jgi:hypothetical protein
MLLRRKRKDSIPRAERREVGDFWVLVTPMQRYLLFVRI